MIDPDVRPCPQHRGEPADNCGPCRSERIADPRAEPDRWSPVRLAYRRERKEEHQCPTYRRAAPKPTIRPARNTPRPSA